MFYKEIMEIVFNIASCIEFLRERQVIHTTNDQFSRNVTRAWQRKKIAELISGCLDEYLWRERYGRNGPAAFENILSHFAAIYFEGRENQPY